MTEPDIIPPTITKVPGVAERVETGPLQFGDDWPGIFIRGDNALAYAQQIDMVLPMLPPDLWALRAMLTGLRDELRSCSVGDTGWPPSFGT